MRTVVVVQARSGSTRLPGKVLLPLGKGTVLDRMIERLQRARTADEIVVATTVLDDDEPIVRLAAARGVRCHRGHPTDLLDRHYEAARITRADVVVKIPSDCPLVDPDVVDRVVTAHIEAHGQCDYTSNLHPESYPDGNDVEALDFDALEMAWKEARLPHEREHTTPFVWEHPERFSLQNVAWETGRDVSRTHRVVVDYAEDYDVVRSIFDAFEDGGRRAFTVADVVTFLDERPSVRLHNATHFGVSWQSRDPSRSKKSQSFAGGVA